MKITRLIVDLLKYRIKGVKFIDFWIGGAPPNSCCSFIEHEYDGTRYITLINFVNK